MTYETSGQGSGNTWNRQIDEEGAFQRKATTFRSWIRADGSTPFSPEALRIRGSKVIAQRAISRKLSDLSRLRSRDLTSLIIWLSVLAGMAPPVGIILTAEDMPGWFS